MTTESFRLGTGTRWIPALAAVMAAALLLLLAPSQSAAAADRSSQLLAQGIGMKHEPSVRVRALQRTLRTHGYSVGRKGADGRFGPRTARAVRRFQRASHLRVDGVVGPRTRAALRQVAGRAAKSRTGRVATKPPATTSSPASPTPVARPAQKANVTPPPSAQVQTRPQSRPDASGGSSWRTPLLVALLAALVVAYFAAIAFVWHRPRKRTAADRHPAVATELPDVTAEPTPDVAKPVAPVAEPIVAAEAAPVVAATPPPEAVLLAESVSAEGATPVVRGGGFAPVRASRLAPHDAVIGYVSVPADAGPNDIAKSESAIQRVCDQSGWRLVDVVRDPDCASLSDPEELSELLERMADGEASALVVSDAWALCRSIDVAELLKRLDEVGAALVAIDLGLDTSTPQGRRVAKALINMSGWGRRRSVPTVVAAAEARATERWAGRLSLDQPEPPAPAPIAGQVVLNGTAARARNGAGAIALNAATARNGNGSAAPNGTGAIAINGNGNGATPRNGNGAIAINGNGGSPDEAGPDAEHDTPAERRPAMRLGD